MAPVSAKAGAAVTAVVRAQRVIVSAAGKGAGKMVGTVVSASYLGGTAAYLIDAEGIRLQANAMIDDRVWREGEAVSVSIAPADCLLLDGNGRRLQ